MNILDITKPLFWAAFLMLAAVPFITTTTYAQDTEEEIINQQDIEKRTNGWFVSEATTIEDMHANEYIKANYKNLSKLYWKKDMFELDDDRAIDQYMMINECEITRDNIKDEFEWLEVQKAARELLKNERSTFSDKFQILLPIDLGTYDMDKKGFPLINDTAYEALRRIEVGGNYVDEVCGYKGLTKNYPANIMLVLKRPFTFDFVSLDEHIAQAFILRRKYQKPKRPKELEGEYFNRLAFMRIRFEVESYQGKTVTPDRETLAVMVGKIHGVEIFEDAEQTRLLTSVDYTDQ